MRPNYVDHHGKTLLEIAEDSQDYIITLPTEKSGDVEVIGLRAAVGNAVGMGEEVVGGALEAANGPGMVGDRGARGVEGIADGGGVGMGHGGGEAVVCSGGGGGGNGSDGHVGVGPQPAQGQAGNGGGGGGHFGGGGGAGGMPGHGGGGGGHHGGGGHGGGGHGGGGGGAGGHGGGGGHVGVGPQPAPRLAPHPDPLLQGGRGRDRHVHEVRHMRAQASLMGHGGQDNWTHRENRHFFMNGPPAIPPQNPYPNNPYWKTYLNHVLFPSLISPTTTRSILG